MDFTGRLLARTKDIRRFLKATDNSDKMYELM
jgi:hypothetical protein